MQSDGNRIKQILSNLISNSIKFTKQGSITLQVKSRLYKSNIVSMTNILQQ